MPRLAREQIELFTDLPEMGKPAAAKPRTTSKRLPGLPGGASPETGPKSELKTGQDLHDSEVWYQRLMDALAKAAPVGGFRLLAEAAVAACPQDLDLRLLAATALLVDGDHKRAAVHLKYFHKRATSPAEPVLQALALNLADRRLAARQLLERHGLTEFHAVYRRFPGGEGQINWLYRQFNAIMGRDQPVPGLARSRKMPATVRGGASNARAGGAKPRGTPRPTQAEPRMQPSGGATASRPAEAVPSTTEAFAPLPLIDVAIPFKLDIDLAPLKAAWTDALIPGGQDFLLRERLAHLGLVQGFDELLCLPHLVGVEPLWHQIETVRKVLRQFRGRVLLADEVGLGKTIEAGMVLKEYALRGMANRVLVLTPASLVGQWQEELARKFGLDFATTYDASVREDPAAFWRQPRIVASIATARRREHLELLAAEPFDLVIVDEAHHLRDRTSTSWKLVDTLQKRFLLLLSATPVQNDLIELYNLLTLLKPGIFKSLKEFRAAYMTPGKPRQPANPDMLRQLLRGAMIRNTRAVVALKLPHRHATTIRVEPARDEREAYAALVEAARKLAADGGGAGRQRLVLHHLLTAGGSSPAAALRSIERIREAHPRDAAWKALADKYAGIETGTKEAAFLELIQRNPAEKKLVFVNARETIEHLANRLKAAGIGFERFDGSMSGPEKDAAIASFRDDVAVLLCTQSGGEGRNIQFCNTLINYDLPWNPMAIEQRIGRIDRIGQNREVFIFNLVSRGTIEEQLLGLLEEKIAMFELVVGEVGAILGSLEEERGFSDQVLEAWLEASDPKRTEAITALGERLGLARRQHEGAKELDERLFGQDFETA